MKIIKKIFDIYKKAFWTYTKQARNAGVTIGELNFVSSHFWSSEPYLIKIGSHCQITSGVKIYTHGGAGAVRRWYPQFDIFGKVTIGDYVYIGNNSLIMPGVTNTKGLSKEKKKELLLSLDESKFVHKSLLKVENP